MADTSLLFDIFARDRGAARAFRDVSRELDGVRDSTGTLRRDTARLATATDDMASSQTRAGLAARRAGLAASEAADRAAASQHRAATAAERLAAGEISEEHAARAATRAMRDLERAQIAQAVAAHAAADAAKDAAGELDGMGQAGDDSQTAMSGMAVSASTALASIAAAAIPAGASVAAFAAIAAPSILKVIGAQKDLAGSWDSLSGTQRVASVQLKGLSDDFARLAKAYEPDALRVFGSALGTVRQVLPTLDPLFKSGTRAAGVFVDQLGQLLTGSHFQSFVRFAADNAVPAMNQLGQALTSTGNLALTAVQDIAPLGFAALGATNGVLKLASSAAEAHPDLVQLGITALLLRGPVTGVASLAGRASTGIRGYAAATRGATLSSRALQLVTKAGPGIFIAAAVAVGALALKMGTATTATDGMIGRLAAQNEAWGNNLTGYQRLAGALKEQITLQRGLDVAARRTLVTEGAKNHTNARAQSIIESHLIGQQTLRMDRLTKAYKDAAKSEANITQGSAALGKEFGITSGQAVKLANAAGVDLSKGILKSGEVTDGVRQKLTQYQAAVAAAKDPTKIISDAWESAADSALTLKDRTTALTNAFAAAFNPSLALYQTTNQLREAYGKAAAAIHAAKGNLDGHSAAAAAARDQFGGLLSLTSQQALALYTQTSATKGAEAATTAMKAAIGKQLPVLYAMAGNSKDATAQVDALAESSQLAAGKSKISRGAFLAAAASMHVTKGRALELWAAYNKLPASKSTKIKGEISDLQHKIEAAKARLKTVPPSKQAAIKASIADLERKVAAAKARLSSLHDKTVTVTTIAQHFSVSTHEKVHALGGIDRYAAGGLRHDLPPHIAAAPTVLYGEPETGGEAYIPLGATKRDRSTMLLAKVADEFGLVVSRKMANGGILAYADGGLDRRRVAHPRPKSHTAQHNAVDSLLTSLTTSMMSSASKVSSFFKTLNLDIRKFLAGGHERRMLAWSKHMQAAMEGLDKKSAAITTKIGEAKSFAAGTTSNARSYASVTGLDFGGAAPTASTIGAGLAGRLGNLRSFSANIKALAGRGLSKGLLRQIIEAGPEQGAALAQAIAQADNGGFAQINDLQKQIDASATGLGRTGADALYDAGKLAGKGFLTGLLGQQAEINAAMKKLAAAMAKTIKHALKIHSPSRVMADLGMLTAQGMAMGLLSGVPAVASAAGTVASASVPPPAAFTATGRTAQASGGPVIQIDTLIVQFADDRNLAEKGREFAAALKAYKGKGGVLPV